MAKNNEQAVAWVKNVADQGLARAQHELAEMYEQGLGGQERGSDALILLRKVADQGYTYAQYDLGTRHKEGRGVAKDDREAFAWLAVSGDEGASDLFAVLSATHWREKYEAAMAQNKCRL